MERCRYVMWGWVSLLALIAASAAAARADDPEDLKSPGSGPKPASVTELKSSPPKSDETDAVKAPEEAEYRVVLKSGAVFEGILKADTETTEERFVVLVVAGIETSFAKKDIETFTRLPTVEERYKDMRSAIDDNDTERLINLAQWLRDRKRYELAAKEVAAALAVEPANKRAKDLQMLIEQQMLLNESAGTGKPRKDRTKESKVKFPALTEDQMNLMKVYEIDLGDPGHVVINPDIIKQLINRYGDHPAMPSSREGREALYRASPESIVELLFKVQARELYGKVRVQTLPKSLALFRENVHKGWLINSCSTTACHGGETAGRFRLNIERPNTDQTALGNMYILERFRTLDGATILNYESPADSLLLQYALPPELARHPHPDISKVGRKKAEFKPVFRAADDARFQLATEWIRSLYKPRPNYSFNLAIPGLDDQSIPEGARKAPGKQDSPAGPGGLSKGPVARPAQTPPPAQPAATPGNEIFPK